MGTCLAFKKGPIYGNNSLFQASKATGTSSIYGDKSPGCFQSAIYGGITSSDAKQVHFMDYIRKLIPFVKPYWKRASLALILLTSLVFMDLSIPRLIQRIIDQGINQHN
jgi:hypothetical protein